MLMAASSGAGWDSSSAMAASVWPGWQYPHWITFPRCQALRTALATGPDAPSTVVTDLPTARSVAVWQAFVPRPSTSTVQAAQKPAPQPNLVPVSSSTSRRTQSSGSFA
jgi:hypothetical protein